MLSKEKNELLTRTGPGTPCGEYMRRFWHPIALAPELPADGSPIRVRAFSQDFVLFREGARPAVLLDLYSEREYPIVERAEAFWAYLGPGEPPLFPNYEFLTAPEEHVLGTKLFHECNFVQGNEGNVDFSHLALLHYNAFQSRGDEAAPFNSRGAAPWRETVKIDPTPTGFRVCRVRNVSAGQHLFMGTYLMPSATAFRGNSPDGYSVNWHVPIDDVTHWKYTFVLERGAFDKEAFRQSRNDLTPDYRGLRNRSNRYLQDRASMRTETYSGIGMAFQAQDACVTEGAGPIQDRTREHLGAADVPVIRARELMFEGIAAVQAGRDPRHVLRDSAENTFEWAFVWTGTIPADKDWREHCRELAPRPQPAAAMA